MARIPDLRQLKKEDFDAKDQNLVDKLAFPINNFMQQVINVLKNGVDYNNLNRQIITVTAQVDSTGTPVNTIQFQSTLTTKIQGLVCIRAINKSPTPRFPTGQPFLSYNQNNSTIVITNIAGIPIPDGQTNSDTYTLTLEAIGLNLPTT